MKIWLINHYAVPPQYYPLARPSLFAKNLISMGHDVTIIAASTIHNSDCKNLIEDGAKVKELTDDGISYLLINCKPYRGNGKNRVINILQFARRLQHVLDTLEKPDAIVSTSFDPISCYEGIKYAKKRGIRAVAEIADLWPETLVAYNGLGRNNLIVRCLRYIEKQIYTRADRVVFTMEGAYDYIVEQGWQKIVPKEKVAFINNGIDIEQFDYNKNHYYIDDDDLLNSGIFKVVYVGAIRKVNNVKKLVDVAKLLMNKQIKFLIWGDGDQLDSIRDYTIQSNITNVVFKGRVEKRYIPFITANADLNIVHNEETPILRFGLSMNKIFDYLAAGRPILVDFKSPYNPIIDNKAGVQSNTSEIQDIANEIELFFNLSNEEKDKLSKAARCAAQKYDFKVLTHKLIEVIEAI